MDMSTVNIKDEINTSILQAATVICGGDSDKVNLPLAPMGAIVDILKTSGLIEVGEMDSNGWQSDFFQVFYNDSANMYIYVTSCGYTGTASISVISEEEVLDSISCEDLEKAIENGIPETEAVKAKLAELEQKDNEEQIYMQGLISRTQELCNRAQELLQNN